MTKKQLMAYMENVLALEGAIQQYREANDAIEKTKLCLCCPTTIKEPVHSEAEKKRFGAPFIVKFFGFFGEIDPPGFGLFALILILIFFLYCFLQCIVMKIPIKSIIVTFVLANIVIDVLRAISIRYKNHAMKNKNDKENLQRDALYQRACGLESDRLSEEKQKKQELSDTSRSIENSIRTLRTQLYTLYGKNILHPSFRGAVTVSYLYKSLSAGVADRLEGPFGAYAQYLNDERANLIIERLDAIVIRLDRIAENQTRQLKILNEMYGTLTDIHRSLDKLCVGMENLSRQVQSLTQAQYDANTYLGSISNELKQISSSIDVVSLNSHVQALNEYRTRIEEGVNSYYLEYPA